MFDEAATIYAANFPSRRNAPNGRISLREPAGKKLIDWPVISQQTAQIGRRRTQGC